MSSVQRVSFGSNYIIPFNQIKNSATMRQLGIETQKFVPDINNIATTKDGIVVKVDDAKDKEYEAVIAKYGINIKKFEGAFPTKTASDINSYSYLVTQLDPKNAQQKIDAYKKMDEQAKTKTYIETYKEFKNSPYSIEKQMNLSKPKLTPTGTPIVNFTDKNGEQFMAREVKLENGYVCMAVSSVKDPNKAALMNGDEFKKIISQDGVQVEK